MGNKDREMNIIKDNLPDLNNIDTIIENFGGTFALIRYLINELNLSKNYIVNDNNENLILMYKYLIDEDNNNKCIEKIKKKIVDIDKEKYNKIVKKKNFFSFLFSNMFYYRRPGVYPKEGIKQRQYLYDKINYFLNYKNINFMSLDAYDLFEKYKDDERCFIFMDPPYFLSENTTYKHKSLNFKFFDI